MANTFCSRRPWKPCSGRWSVEENTPTFTRKRSCCSTTKVKPTTGQRKAIIETSKYQTASRTLCGEFKRDHPDFPRLSFGKLRKTAGDLIRRFADGEIHAVFMCHGQPVATDNLTDVYSNRPFGKVFKAIREVQEYLQPVFAAAGATPFESRLSQFAYRSETHDRIIDLRSQGRSVREIAAEVSRSQTAVRQHLHRQRRLEMGVASSQQTTANSGSPSAVPLAKERLLTDSRSLSEVYLDAVRPWREVPAIPRPIMGLHGGIRVVRSQAVVVQSKEEAADRFPPGIPFPGIRNPRLAGRIYGTWIPPVAVRISGLWAHETPPPL